MNIEELLSYIISYYKTTRGVGHTTVIREGVKKTKAIIVVNKENEKNRVRNSFDIYSENIVTLQDIQKQLAGRHQPLVFDNYALIKIFDESLNEIQTQKKRANDAVASAIKDVTKKNKYIIELEEKVNRLEDFIDKSLSEKEEL